MSVPRIIATIEARMTSSRLPGKVMKDACGKPMLAHLIERLSRVHRLDGIVVATTTNADDDCLVELAASLGVGSYRGSENDVLSRVLCAAESARADLIVEITGDCPLVDPDIVAQTIELYLLNQHLCDYASNVRTLSYPIGMDAQVFAVDLLRLADKEGQLPEDREHVSWFFLRNPSRFRLMTLPAPPSLRWPELRLTLDETADYQLIRTIFQTLYPTNPRFSCGDILKLLRSSPELVAINADVVQKMPAAPPS